MRVQIMNKYKTILLLSMMCCTFNVAANSDAQKQVLWGDTHLHTTLSLDARSFGVTLDQATAYRFARGEQVKSTHGLDVKLARPLDFLVVSDHSDAMGTMSEIIDGNPKFTKNEKVAEWHTQLNTADKKIAFKARMDVVVALTQGTAPDILFDRVFFNDIWQKYVDTAEEYNDPGTFTAMIGYEWTSTLGGNNLHRNVLYRDDASYARQLLPYTVKESGNPEDLWVWLQNYEDKTGGQILALAHNGNLSNGLMFPEINPETNKPINADYAKTRARWEPLYEVTQIKGDGEAHPFLSKNDEFASYETWDRSNMGGVPKQNEMLQYEYARAALKKGLTLETSLGTNPYQFGMIGSTDSHTGLATADEDNFFGKMSYLEPSIDRWKTPLAKVGELQILGWQMATSGYAAVWATENTREAIFDAMQRRETYATTGPRITVRFDANLGEQNVPMGGVLSPEPNVNAPVFDIVALKDPIGANLDRIQVIKGWVDSNGAAQEKIFNVAWGSDRALNKDASLTNIGNTVDIANASYENNIGEVELKTQWQDPEFNKDQSSFYYARVLEIPTPRWTAFDAKRFGSEMSDDTPMVTQERAYTSPIWYTP